MTTTAPIPIPWRQRWRDIRLRYLPALIFVVVAIFFGVLWKKYAAAPTIVGQAEVVPGNISSSRPGMLAQLSVSRFQAVKAGEAIGQVLVTDPKILAASLAVVQAEIEQLRISLLPVADEQRLAMQYNEVRLHWMAQRAQLGVAKADLGVAISELHRTEELYKDKIISERAIELARAKQASLQSQVEELARSVEEQGRNIDKLQLTNGVSISTVSDAPLRAAIAVEESKLKLTEAEMSPVILRAAVDGVVDAILHRPGEAVTAGEPIVTISPASAVRIIGYLRPPVLVEPKVGSRVEVRTRGPGRPGGSAQIVELGIQFEPLPLALQIPVRLANTELGLPVAITVPPGLKIRPGELVDLTLAPRGPGN